MITNRNFGTGRPWCGMQSARSVWQLLLLLFVLVGAGGCEVTKELRNGFVVRTSGPFGSPGSPWTILCLEVRGAQHQDVAARLADTLKQTRGIRASEVIVVSDEADVSRIYYGVYYRKTSSRTGKRSVPANLKRDVQLIKELATPDGRHYFALARTVRLPTPDIGPEEWRLDRTGAKYSLQVAVFEPTDEFWQYKQAAVDYCEMLRERGYDAYFHHGEGASMVTVGRFGADAVIIPPRGLPRQSAEVTALQKDELLKYNVLNGRVYTAKADDGSTVRVRSRLVEVPAPGASW